MLASLLFTPNGRLITSPKLHLLKPQQFARKKLANLINPKGVMHVNVCSIKSPECFAN